MSEVRRTNEHWDDKKKVEVVTTYLAVGKMPLVEAITGVPVNTLRAWKYQPWWDDLVSEIQREDDHELDSKLAKIVDKSLEVVLDRLENGDFILNSKTGEITRIPLKAKDVHRVSIDMIDKRQLIRNRKENIKIEVNSVDDYLKKLAQQFTEFVKKQLPRTIEGESLAIYERREEGLQAGSEVVHESPGRHQEEGSAERSPQRDGS